MSFLPGGGSNLGNFGGQGQPQSYYDMTPEQQAQAGAEAMMRFMTSCPGKSVFAGVTGFALGGVFGLFMASVWYTVFAWILRGEDVDLSLISWETFGD